MLIWLHGALCITILSLAFVIELPLLAKVLIITIGGGACVYSVRSTLSDHRGLLHYDGQHWSQTDAKGKDTLQPVAAFIPWPSVIVLRFRKLGRPMASVIFFISAHSHSKREIRQLRVLIQTQHF